MSMLECVGFIPVLAASRRLPVLSLASSPSGVCMRVSVCKSL